MTDFEYDNIPDSFEMISPLPDDMIHDVAHLYQAAANKSGLLMAQEAKIAYMYNRKGYIAMDSFGGPRNNSYGTENDDIVIQLTIRIQNPQLLPSLKILENELKERKVEAQRQQLLETVQLLEASKNTVEKNLKEAKEKLSELDVQK